MTLQQAIASRIVGYPEDVLNILIATVLSGYNALILGTHGMGKTTLAECLAKAFRGRWTKYNAAVDDHLVVYGAANPAELVAGKLCFAGHQKSVHDQRVIVIDEWNRALRECASMWMDLLDNRTRLDSAEKLPLEVVLATANPAVGYTGASEPDPAALDRFAIVISLDIEPTEQVVDNITAVNLGRLAGCTTSEEFPDARQLKERMSTQQHLFLKAPGTIDAITKWNCHFIPAVLKAISKTGQRISARTFGQHVPWVLVALITHDLANQRPISESRLAELARQVAFFCLGTKLDIPRDILTKALEEARAMLPPILGCLPNPSTDPLFPLMVGGLAARIRVLERMNVGTHPEEDRGRLEMAALKLIRDTMSGALLQPDLPARLWTALEKAPQLRSKLELLILRERVNLLIDLAAERKRQGTMARQRLVKRGQRYVSDPELWLPTALTWTRK